MTTAIGISEHNGWAELVTMAIQDAAPVILDRRRVELIGSGEPSNPYHHEALELPLDSLVKPSSQKRRNLFAKQVAAGDSADQQSAAAEHGMRAVALHGISDKEGDMLRCVTGRGDDLYLHLAHLDGVAFVQGAMVEDEATRAA